MASRRQAPSSAQDRIADELIAQLREVPGVLEIYSEYMNGDLVVTAFVESEDAEYAAVRLEFNMYDRHPDCGVDVRIYKPTAEDRAAYRAIVPETLEWARD